MLALRRRLRAIRYDPEVGALIRADRPDDDVEALRARLVDRQAVLAERADGFVRAQSELAAFGMSYRRDVGTLHDELDDLERAIAEAELGELSRLVEDAAGEQAPSPAEASAPPGPRFTSDAIRKLFRDVARTVHPDLARDDQTRTRRHSLMAEANRAYALGDEERLRWVLEAWEKSPEAVLGSDPEAARLRLIRRIAEVEEQLDAYARELASLHDSPLWQLKAMVDEAAAQGKDLVSDMIRRLQRDIMASRNRLDAMRWNP